MPTLERIRGRVAYHVPDLAERAPGAPQAAVALIVCEPREGPCKILFIERAIREADPWSGHMAFPGGRWDPGDVDLRSTAVRETREEVGVALGDPIGRLDDVQGSRGPRRQGLVVSPFVFEIQEPPVLRSSPEVQSALWIPVPHLLDPESSVRHRLEGQGVAGTFPAVRFERYTIWGLTYRILRQFFQILDHELPGE